VGWSAPGKIPRSPTLLLGLVDAETSAVELVAIEPLSGGVGNRCVGKFDERDSPWTAGFAIRRQGHAQKLADLPEETLEIFPRRVEVQIADEQLCGNGVLLSRSAGPIDATRLTVAASTEVRTPPSGPQSRPRSRSGAARRSPRTPCPPLRPLPSSFRWRAPSNGGPVGDKSPKSKQRDQKQKDKAKAGSAAKPKQPSFGQPQPPGAKGKK